VVKSSLYPFKLMPDRVFPYKTASVHLLWVLTDLFVGCLQ